MKKILLFTILCYCISLHSQQSYKISGAIKDTKREPLESVAIKLIDANSALLKYYTISNDNGFFEISDIVSGNYKLVILSLGYQDYQRDITINNNSVLGDIILQDKSIELDEVVIIAEKRILKTTETGFQLNVQGTALERKKDVLSILKYAPNVNGLEIAGSSAIKLLLNGKEVKIKPKQYRVFLKTIKPNTIKNIEIIDRTDASFEGDITGQINIVTIKNTGFTGSIGSSISYNNFFGSTTYMSFFYSKNKLRYFINLYLSDHKSESKGNGIQIINNDLTYNLQDRSNLKRQERGVILGFDYDIDSLSSIGFLYDYTGDNDKDFNIISNQQINSTIVQDSLLQIVKDFDHINKTHTLSLQYQKKLDTLGSNLKISTDYVINSYEEPLMIKSDFFSNVVLVDSTETSQRDNTNSKILGFKLDLEKKLSNGNSFSTGSKFSFNRNTNNYDYFDRVNNEFVFNETFSNNFNFDETIYALYFNYRIKFKKTSLSMGSRLEYNVNRFGFDRRDTEKNNLKLLPTLYYNIPFSKNNTLYLYAAKKITRPSYYRYNSTIIEFTPTQASSGNAFLKPVDTYIFQFGYTYKKKYSLLGNYSYQENNIILNSQFTEDKGHTLTQPVNSGYKNSAFIMLSTPVNFFDWWESTNKASLKYTNFFTPLILTRQHFESTYATFSSYHSFYLTDNIEIDINFSYSTAYKNLYYSFADNFSTGIDISTSVLNDKIDIWFSISDVFNSQRSIYEYRFNEIFKRTYSKSNTRGFYFGITYNFSAGKKVDDSVLKSNIESEKRRISH